MLKINIETNINQSPQKIFEGFNQDLFEALNPPFPKAKVIRFDGCKKGDEVHLAIDFIFFKLAWVSVITEKNESTHEIYFVDEGRILPFFIKRWRHKHIIRQNLTQQSSVIIDAIEFSSGLIFVDYLLYPMLFLQFLWRKPIYRKIWG